MGSMYFALFFQEGQVSADGGMAHIKHLCQGIDADAFMMLQNLQNFFLPFQIIHLSTSFELFRLRLYLSENVIISQLYRHLLHHLLTLYIITQINEKRKGDFCEMCKFARHQ